MGTVEWIVLASVGVLVGLGLGFFLGRLGGKGSSQKLADVEAELEEYRQEVSQHFSRSAEHFQAIGRQYRELYEHMAAGSEKLCVGAPTDGQLKFPRPDEVAAPESKVEAARGDDVATTDDDTSRRDAPESEPEPVADAKQQDDAAVDAATEDSDEAKKTSDELEAAAAPVDYADDDPKNRQYH